MVIRHRTASSELEGLILDAALELLVEKGAQSLTVRGIATRAGVAPMGIYNRFEGKNGVYEALWIQGFERLCAALESVQQTGDPVADLNECGRQYRSFALANPSHYRMLFLEVNSTYTPSVRAAEVSGRSLLVLINMVERCQRAGRMPDVPPIELAQDIWATVHGFVSLELLNMNFAGDADRAFNNLLTAVQAGFEARASAH